MHYQSVFGSALKKCLCNPVGEMWNLSRIPGQGKESSSDLYPLCPSWKQTHRCEEGEGVRPVLNPSQFPDLSSAITKYNLCVEKLLCALQTSHFL